MFSAGKRPKLCDAIFNNTKKYLAHAKNMLYFCRMLGSVRVEVLMKIWILVKC